MPRPSCGINIPSGTSSTVTIVVGTVGTIFSIAGSAGAVWEGVAAGSTTFPLLVAAVAGIAVFATVVYFAVDRCNQSPKGEKGCVAGVIETITPAFTGSTVDNGFPFASQHDRVDVVVKKDYWDLIDAQSDFVFCSQADQSPMVPCFYYNPAVCNAGIGGSIGAGVGVVGGLLIAAVVVAAIGCATWILCLVALIVAVLIVVAAAIIGAVTGGQIGRAATSQPGPTSSGSEPQALQIGDYVTEQGSLVKYGDLDNALAFYFVQTTTLHGRSFNLPSYSHTDPDQNLVPDACPVTIL